MHPLYISYIIFFSPYIFKLLCFLLPLHILLLTTALCAFSTFFSNTFRIRPKEDASNDPLEAEAYKIIFDNFHDTETSFPDKSGELEVYKQINIQALVPEIVKHCCSSTPLHDPPMHETFATTDISLKDKLVSTDSTFNNFHNLPTCVANNPDEVEAYSPLHETIAEDEPSTNIIFTTFHNSATSVAKKTEVETSKDLSLHELGPRCISIPPQYPLLHADMANCNENKQSIIAAKLEDETETIIKHTVCIKINKHQTAYDEQFKAADEVQINKAEISSFPPTPKTGSNDLHKTSRSYDLSNTKSMRREKEWTRTLACKLFEERHNSHSGEGGDDGMDMLWETLEDEPIEPSPQPPSRRGTMSRWSSKSVKSDLPIRVCAEEDGEDDGDVDEEDDVAGSGKMCCLQALKISSGKINLGIKSKNLIKFSKVLRGFGWLHKTSDGNNFRK